MKPGTSPFTILCLLCFSVWACVEPVEAEEFDFAEARTQCSRGVTVYCLALGFEEAKLGKKKEALKHYRMACESHKASGHLRACAPMLSQAREMGLLEQESQPLVDRCEEGDRQTCFYLGKEFLKIGEIDLAADYLEPLCREKYRPPDSDDYGPCFHLARSLERVKEFPRARSLLAVDCPENNDPNHPSCRALASLNRVAAESDRKAWALARTFEPAEAMIWIVVLVPVLAAGIRLWGSGRFTFFLRWGALILVFGAWSAWEILPRNGSYPPTVYVLFFFSLLTLMVLSVYSEREGRDNRRIQATPQNGKDSDQSPSPPDTE